MKKRMVYCKAVLFTVLLLIQQAPVYAQATLADYVRAAGLRERFQELAINIADRANWIGTTTRFWYRKSIKGGNQFVLVDAETLDKKPAFDHEKLATSLSAAAGHKYTALKLPFNSLTFVDSEKAIEFVIPDSPGGPPPANRFGPEGTRWKCELS